MLYNNSMTDQNMFPTDEAIVLVMPVVVKAIQGSGRRFSVGVSSETVDLEQDMILQEALLKAAPGFLAGGAPIDIDHISECGARYNIPNPQSYIIGKALSVVDLGGKQTGIEGEIFPEGHPQADKFWKGLTSGEVYRSSIYGFPESGGFVDCTHQKSLEYPQVGRFLIKSIRWTSLAMTKTPVNDGITHNAQVITAKAFIHGLRQVGSYGPMLKSSPEPAPNNHPFALPMPRNRVELLGHHTHHMQNNCPSCASGEGFGNSIKGFREHFMKCCGADYDTSDIHAHALAHLLKRH
jgi:hypothetical protein